MTSTQFIEQYESPEPILQFRDLPKNHQVAVIWYMYCDGDAWDPPYDDCVGWKQDWKEQHLATMSQIRRNLKKWIEKFGDTEWGVANIPTKKLVAYIWQQMTTEQEWGDEFDSFDEYHKWYYHEALYKSGKRHNMIDQWPCIWSLHDNAISIEDGWHRFHAYVRANCQTVPVVYSWNLLDSIKPL